MLRVKDQVESFVAYGGYQNGMSVGEILGGARADRLVKKELEKNISSIVLNLATHKSDNKLIDLPNVNWQTEKYKIRGESAVKVAKEIESSLKLHT